MQTYDIKKLYFILTNLASTDVFYYGYIYLIPPDSTIDFVADNLHISVGIRDIINYNYFMVYRIVQIQNN